MKNKFFMTEGRLFHKVGPAWAKARVPQVVANFGITREPELDERRDLTGCNYEPKSILYWGAVPWTQWKVRSKILKIMRSLTCNQWSDFKMGVMWVCFLDNVMIRAAAFWSLCSNYSYLAGGCVSEKTQVIGKTISAVLCIIAVITFVCVLYL